MWILDKIGAAYDLNKMIAIHCNDEHAPFRVKAFTEKSTEGDKYFFPLADFKTREDAKAYIADLVHKLNGDTPEPDLRAITSLNDLSHIHDELNIIFDSLYPPENRDAALTHTKELIEYVDLLIAEIGGDQHD